MQEGVEGGDFEGLCICVGIVCAVIKLHIGCSELEEHKL